MISGRVKVKHGVEVAELKENSVVFSDGSEIPADAVIFAYVLVSLLQLDLDLNHCQDWLPLDTP